MVVGIHRCCGDLRRYDVFNGSVITRLVVHIYPMCDVLRYRFGGGGSGNRLRGRIGRFDNAESGQEMLVFRDHGHAVGRAEVFDGGRMAAAARHLVKAVGISHRIGLVASEIGAVPVVTPLFDVAVHVVQSEGIGRALRHGQIDGDERVMLFLILQRRFGKPVAEGVVHAGAGPARVFPFGFGRKPVGAALLFGEPAAKRIGLMPVHEDHGFVVPARKPLFAAQGAVRRIERFVLGVGDLGDGHPERSGDDHFVDRRLVVVCARSAGTHVEPAGRDFREPDRRAGLPGRTNVSAEEEQQGGKKCFSVHRRSVLFVVRRFGDRYFQSCDDFAFAFERGVPGDEYGVVFPCGFVNI